MDAKWLWLGLLIVVGFFAVLAWRNQTFKPIPTLLQLVQVLLVVGLGGYTAYRFIA